MCWRGELLGGRRLGGILLIPWNTISSVLRKHFLSNMFAYKNFISFFCVFSYCSCKQETKEQYWRQQFRQKERDFSVQLTEMTRPVKEDHLQSRSRIFQSDQTERVCSIWCTNQNFWNFGLNGKSPSFSVFRNFQVSCWKMEGNQLIDHSKVSAVRYSC